MCSGIRKKKNFFVMTLPMHENSRIPYLIYTPYNIWGKALCHLLFLLIGVWLCVCVSFPWWFQSWYKHQKFFFNFTYNKFWCTCIKLLHVFKWLFLWSDIYIIYILIFSLIFSCKVDFMGQLLTRSTCTKFFSYSLSAISSDPSVFSNHYVKLYFFFYVILS